MKIMKKILSRSSYGNRFLPGVKQDVWFYALTIILFGCVSFWVIQQGAVLEYKKEVPRLTSTGNLFSESFYHNIHSPLVILIVQIAVILCFTKLVGYCLKGIGQPAVIGEILAGILLGPSLLGFLLPSVGDFLFPKNSMSNLSVLSQIGLMLYMFATGTEVDMGYLRKQVRAAVIISHMSIIIPFALGIGAAYFLYEPFAGNISFLAFALFIGISMSITAFPVLVRIIKEKGLAHTRIGIMAIPCAASDDITAWCLLAVAIAIVKTGSFLNSLFTIVLAAGYVLFMFLVVRPFLKWLLSRSMSDGKIAGNVRKSASGNIGEDIDNNAGNKPGDVIGDSTHGGGLVPGMSVSTSAGASGGNTISKNTMAAIFLVLLLSSYITEAIGIHALFGAFLAGVIMPSDSSLRKGLVDKVEHVSVILLLPLFFVFSGLRTRIGLLDQWHLWVICLGIIAAAIAGKFGGTTLAARFAGFDLRESLGIGALMNTRGLMELIALNIGYELGVLSPVIFTMMVIMALVTTFMTSPVLNLIDRI